MNASTNVSSRNFYRGKVIRIVVGFPPGGGADVYSRLIARHLGRFIPGNPTLAVTNMPGAGSIIAGNQIYNSAAKDGTEIGMLNGAVILEQLFGNPGVHFDMAKFRYLAVPVNETYVMIVTRQSGIAKFSDLLGRECQASDPRRYTQLDAGARADFVARRIDANLKVVSGYKGSADIRLAVDSGEDRRLFQSLVDAQAEFAGQIRKRRMVRASPAHRPTAARSACE